MDYAQNSIIGKRDNQEDYGLITEVAPSGALLAVLSDGMGGQVAGEVASYTAVNGFIDSFSSNNSLNLPLKLSVALDKANRAVARCSASNAKLKGMGATLIAVHVYNLELSWISVGDSVLYLYRDKKLKRLNSDHSMMPVLIDSVRVGKLTQEEALTHPHRNALRSAITGEEIPLIDLQEVSYKLKKNDIIILATDGVLTLNELEVSQILDSSSGGAAKNIVDQLLSAVSNKNKPRQDNTLVQVVKASGSGHAKSIFSSIAIGVLFFALSVALTFVAWENKELILNSIGFESIKKETNAPTTQSIDSKVTPFSLEDKSSKPEKSQPLPSNNSEAVSHASAKSNELSLKSGKAGTSEKKQTGIVKAGAITLRNDSPTNIIIEHNSAPTNNEKTAVGVAVDETPQTIKPSAKPDVPLNDGDRAKQWLEDDHTSNGKSAK